jgi:hypothetical protein
MLSADPRFGVVGRAQGRRLDHVLDPQHLSCMDDASLHASKALIVAREKEQAPGARERGLEEVRVAQICLKPGDVRYGARLPCVAHDGTGRRAGRGEQAHQLRADGAAASGHRDE